MTEKELEYLLLENLKYAKENHHYLIKIDRRQRWRRNWTAVYWSVLILLAIGGYYYAFPYLEVLKDQLNSFNTQLGGIIHLTNPGNF
jgi:multisubunit Na+/H+ antiporter MnhB subunit